APAMVAVKREGEPPLSYAQRRLWFINQLQPEGIAYNCPFNLRLVGDLDRGMLERCLNEIVRRHEILRTTFPVRDGQPVQAIHPPRTVRLPVIDLSSLTNGQKTKAAKQLRQAESEQRFDLGKGPLFR